MKHIKTALIGFGYRGKQLLRLLRTIENFEIVGIADINGCGGSESPGASFYQGEEAYKMMLDEQQPNLVFITTPWHLHITHATECILRNCHVALEIKGGLCQDEYAPLQEIAQQKGVKVFPLENTLFMREILAVKRMVDEGALGEIIYMRGGYRHDLRKLLLDDNGVLGGRKGTESVWRSRFYSHHNADIYPTHGLGPLCMILGIGKTDHLAWLTSFATKAVGLRQHMSEDDNTPITLGDIISTQIETQGGTLISLTHDTTLPRPRSLDFEIQGSLGIWDGVNRRIYLEKMNTETWVADGAILNQYESREWQLWGKDALKHDSHHQGMDYIMLKSVAADILAGAQHPAETKESVQHPAETIAEIHYPATLNDLALWTSVTLLSEISIREHRRVAFGNIKNIGDNE